MILGRVPDHNNSDTVALQLISYLGECTGSPLLRRPSGAGIDCH
jgi:hypothetical protein